MKKILTILLIGLALINTTLFANGDQEKGPKQTTMKVSIGVAESHFEYKACVEMKNYIEKSTNNSVKVELYPSAQIGNDQEVFEGLPLGIAQMVPCGSDLIGNSSKNFGLLSLPYLFDNIDQVDKVMTGDFGKNLLAELDSIGYKGLGFGYFGSRHITNNKKPIETVEDLKGLKIRTMTTPIHLAVFKAMGANPTPMAFSDLFSALQQGVVDGQENPLMNIYSNKLNEVQKYLTLDGHVFTFVTFVVASNWYDSLSTEQQKAVEEGVKIACEYMKDSCKSSDEIALTKMQEEGMQVTFLDEKAKSTFRNAVKGVSEEYGNAINPSLYKELLKAIDNAK